MDTFTKHYIIAALWSSSDDTGKPLDERFTSDDFAPSAIASIKADCKHFQTANAALLAEAYKMYPPGEDGPEAHAGHDFWLTRNFHGVGFWDRGLGLVGTNLTEAAHRYGSSDIYEGDDGKLYVEAWD